MQKLILGVDLNTLIQHPTGHLEHNVTGRDLVNNFRKYHKVFKAYYNKDWWNLKKKEMSNNSFSLTKNGTQTLYKNEPVLEKGESANTRTGVTVKVLKGKSKKKLSVKGKHFSGNYDSISKELIGKKKELAKKQADNLRAANEKAAQEQAEKERKEKERAEKAERERLEKEAKAASDAAKAKTESESKKTATSTKTTTKK